MFLRNSLTATINDAILTTLIQAELIHGNQIYTVVLSIMLNRFRLMRLSIRSTVKQKVDKINSLLTCLRRVHFRGTGAGFLSPCIVCDYIVCKQKCRAA